jgi:hypothetical protein
MATVLGPPDLMYEKIAKTLGTDVIMFTKKANGPAAGPSPYMIN